MNPGELRERMRAIYEDSASAAGLARQGQAAVRTRFTWDAAATKVATGLHELVSAGKLPLSQDADEQYRLRMQEGETRWERGEPHAALRNFVLARELCPALDAEFNVASILHLAGDHRTAAPMLDALSRRTGSPESDDEQQLRADVQALLAQQPAPASPAAGVNGDGARVRWYAPIFNASGYASESRGFLAGLLADTRWDVALAPQDPVRDTGILCPDEFRTLEELSRKPGGSPAIDFQHGPAHTFTAPAAELSVCRTMLETDRIPADWAEACNRFTEVWVPTEFNRDTFARSGVVREKIRIVPGAINATLYDPALVEGRRVSAAKDFQFLSVFDFTPRKGWEILLRAYFEEFGASEHVSLVVKVVNFFREAHPAEKVRELIEAHGFRDLPELILIDRECSDGELRELYAGSDAFALASRGEGWGRPYMEAMAFGLPTIGTRWSGNLEFMNDENSFLIDIDGLEPCEQRWSSMAVYRGHRWAVPSIASLRRQMRTVFEDRSEGRRRGARAWSDVLAHYDIPVVGARFQAELDRLLCSR